MEFVTIVGQSMGPEALATYINPPEFLKRLAAASGIETVGLVKDEQTIQAEREEAQQQAQQQTLLNQAGQLAKSPLAEQAIENGQQQQPPNPEEVEEG